MWGEEEPFRKSALRGIARCVHVSGEAIHRVCLSVYRVGVLAVDAA